jgi:malate synthase
MAITDTDGEFGVQVTGPMGERYAEVLDAQALGLIADLHRRFDARRRDLLAARVRRQQAFDAGERPDFLPDTAHVRDSDWTVPPPAPGLADRRVEITGPTDRKMTVNALNSGANVWLADFEDAITPLWENVIGGQLNLRDALDGTLEFTENGKHYAVGDKQPTIVVRPRGLHLPEKHVLIDGQRAAGAFVDFALYFAGCARRQLERGSGPYFYLPKLESHLEARLWNDVFDYTERLLEFEPGTIRATVLIETITAAFEMDEILYELRTRAAGLNAGRWDYLFSIIKKFRRGALVLPDRNSVVMTAPMMRAYTDLLVHTCHRRGALAIGGMAAFIPNRHDPQVNETAFAKVTDDKQREAGDGFDGSWVAHPDLVPVCRAAFDAVLAGRPNQLETLRADVTVSAGQLLDIAALPGDITATGLRSNVGVALQYLRAWLGGRGAVGIYNLMEDAATAEICRSQIWQWLNAGARLDTGETVTRELVRQVLDEQIASLGDEQSFAEARALFEEVTLGAELPEFLTTSAYERMP